MPEFAEHLQNALGSNYQLDHELTGGGMSRVFVATDRVLGRRVVVKVLPPDLAAGVNRDRFRREIQVVAQLQHPHIVPLLSAGEQDDLLWYTMPFIEGESLRAGIERKRPFTARDITRILHDIVDALAFAHARGVIHRDIKPANVLMQGSHALVTDFGVAKALSAAMPIGGVISVRATPAERSCAIVASFIRHLSSILPLRGRYKLAAAGHSRALVRTPPDTASSRARSDGSARARA